MVIAGVLFGVLFAITSISRGDVAPGLVGGALGAVLVYLVLQRVQEHNTAVRRRREEKQRSG
jgi:L-lactate permease